MRSSLGDMKYIDIYPIKRYVHLPVAHLGQIVYVFCVHKLLS